MEIDHNGNFYAPPSLDWSSSVGGPLDNAPELSEYGSQTVPALSAAPSPNPDEEWLNITDNDNLSHPLHLDPLDRLHQLDGLEVRQPNRSSQKYRKVVE